MVLLTPVLSRLVLLLSFNFQSASGQTIKSYCRSGIGLGLPGNKDGPGLDPDLKELTVQEGGSECDDL